MNLFRIPRIIVGIASLFLILGDLSAERLRVASWNVRNYNICDRMVDGVWTPAYPKPEAEKEALRVAILAVAPDVIVFQEMGAEGFLEELRLDLASLGLDYAYSALLRGQDKDRCLAALSKRPFAAVQEHRDLKYSVASKDYRVRRGLLGLQISSGGQDWTLYTAHLRSRYGSEAEQDKLRREREGEARAIRDRIARDNPAEGSLWLFTGDINDNPGSGAWRRLCEKNGQKLGVDLRPRDSRGDSWTYYYATRDVYERIDMMLASSALAAYVVDSGIWDAPEWFRASDHRLLYVDMDLPDVTEGVTP